MKMQISELSPRQLQLLDEYRVPNCNTVMVDSAFSRLEVMDYTTVPAGTPRNIHELMVPLLSVVSVVYWGYDRRIHLGQIVVHYQLAVEMMRLFQEMFRQQFPIQSVIPQSMFGYDDLASMKANNSSAYRPEVGSEHRKGSAIDINPRQNPFDITRYDLRCAVAPPGAVYNPLAPGTLTMDGGVHRHFASRGWEWGGNWGNPYAQPAMNFYKVGYFDHMHFQLDDSRYDWFERVLALDVPKLP